MLHRPMFADRRMAGTKFSAELATPKYICAVWLVARKSLITNVDGFFLNSTAHCERNRKKIAHKAKRMKWKWENKLQAHKYKHA